jgi:hypothetical protein
MLYLDEENDSLWALDAMGLHPCPVVEKAYLFAKKSRPAGATFLQFTIFSLVSQVIVSRHPRLDWK